MNSPWPETLDTEVREERDDEGVRMRGDAVHWLVVGEAMATKVPVESGRRGDEGGEGPVRYAEKLKAGGR